MTTKAKIEEEKIKKTIPNQFLELPNVPTLNMIWPKCPSLSKLTKKLWWLYCLKHKCPKHMKLRKLLRNFFYDHFKTILKTTNHYNDGVSINLSIYIYLYIYLSIYLSIHLSIYIYIYLSTYLGCIEVSIMHPLGNKLKIHFSINF